MYAPTAENHWIMQNIVMEDDACFTAMFSSL
jgi:hypothetical protein